MAVVWTDLTQPAGEIDGTVLFKETGSTLQTRLTAYIADGEARVGDLTGDEADAFVTAWAYYRAYLAKYQIELDKMSTKAFVDEGSASKLWSQINGWKELADAKLAETEELIPPVVPAATRAPSPATSQAAASVRW